MVTFNSINKYASYYNCDRQTYLCKRVKCFHGSPALWAWWVNHASNAIIISKSILVVLNETHWLLINIRDCCLFFVSVLCCYLRFVVSFTLINIKFELNFSRIYFWFFFNFTTWLLSTNHSAFLFYSSSSILLFRETLFVWCILSFKYIKVLLV